MSRIPLGLYLSWVGLGSQCFLWFLVAAKYCFLNVYFLASVSFPYLWLERAGFSLGLFFLFVSVGISRLPALPAHSLRYAREQENSGNSSLCCFLGPGVPSPSAFFSLPFNHHTLVLYVLYLYFEDEVHQLHLPRSWGSHSSLFLKGKENFVYKMIILKV